MSNNKEILIIRNFGPIKSVELELSRFNVFIGEQGTGKSTVAKVLAVCRYFSYIIDEDYKSSYFSSQDNFSNGLISWGLDENIVEGSYIQYTSKHYVFTAEAHLEKEYDEEYGTKEWIEIKTKLELLSPEFENLLSELKKIKPPLYPSGKLTTRNLGWIIPTSFFQNDVADVMDNPFYLPTERGLQSIFSLGKNSIPNLSDFLYNQFAKIDQISRIFNEDTSIVPLNIVYKNLDGRSVIKNDKHGFISLSNAASGYQSTIPVVLLMEYYISIRKKAKTFIIEEPELNLFPSAQKELMQYLVDKTMNYGNTMLLTTHSPYVLASLNTMLAAYKSGLKDKDATNKVIPEKYLLNPDDISVYELLSDGTCEDIVDREERLIKAEKIDIISNTLNEQFEALLNIEFSER